MQTQVTINSRGVVTLPAKIRKAMGFQPNDQLIAETTPQGLLLRPTVTLPLEMYTPERVQEFDAAEADLALLLAQRGARVQVNDSGGNAFGASGNTAMHYAMAYKFHDLASWLASPDGGGASDAIMNNDGRGPYDGLE